MKTGRITYRLPAQAEAYRQIPSVSCGTTSFRSFIVLLLIIFCLGQFEKFCISVNIKQKKNLHKSFAAQKIVYGLTHYMNVTFTKTCIISLMCSNLFVLFLILKLSGDIQSNPGPQSDSFLSSNISTVFPHNLNILHLNIQSILPKMDLLEVEVQNYDILVFTETWLSPQISNDDLLLENFDPPYRQDRHAKVGGGVAIYIASGIPSCKRNDIIQGDKEGICMKYPFSHNDFYYAACTGRQIVDLVTLTSLNKHLIIFVTHTLHI